MKVTIKNFNVAMEIKNAGIELEVRRTDGSHLGDLVITKSHLIWCPGRTTRERGHKVTWDRFIQMITNAG